VIRVLVAEDSPVVREYLVYLLGQDPSLIVVGTACDGVETVAETERLKPDVILMDVHMPRMNGLEATRVIMARFPTPIVMVSASFARDEVALTFETLKAGALTLVAKPKGLGHQDQEATSRQLVETVRLMAEVPVVRRWQRDVGQGSGVRGQGLGVGGSGELIILNPPSLIPRIDRKIRLVAIGASTGGPQALAEILRGLPGDSKAPILIVQHIAPGFVAGLAAWLGQQSKLNAKLAEADETARPGTAYIAPDGVQMGIARGGQIRLDSASAGGDFCPSASYLFDSVATSYDRSAVGILLTGMGRDGAVGLRRLRDAGGVTIVQDEESSAIFGMPKEAIRLGAAEHVLSPGQIGTLLRTLLGARAQLGQIRDGSQGRRQS
jgi:two-component system, chemotaxis family, protein-glutamate methylesterase/glutaminase